MPKRKPTPVEKPVALSEFGRQVGCTSKTIERYIAAGKIFGPAVTQSGTGKNKVYPSLAKPQYDAAQLNVGHRFARSRSLAEQTPGASAKPKPATPKLSPLENLELDNLLAFADMDSDEASEKIAAHLAGSYPLPDGPATDLLLAEHGKPPGKPGKKEAARLARQQGEVIEGPRRPQPHGGNLKTGKDKVDADITGMSEMSEDELSSLDINQLTKREAVLRVIAKQLEIGKVSGDLVAVEKVRSGLFSFGVEIRKRFEAMPHRVVDSIRNAKNRADALSLFNREVNDCLNALAGFGEVVNTIKSSRTK